MANAGVNDIIRVTWNGQAFNQRIMFQHDYRILSLEGAQDIRGIQQQIVDQLSLVDGDIIESKYVACLSTSYSGLTVSAQRIYPIRMRRTDGPMSGVGNAGASELTTIQAALNLYTEQSGRDQHSVKKIGPLPTSDTFIDNGLLTTAMKNLLVDLAQAVLNDVNMVDPALVLRPVVFHTGNQTPRYSDLIGATIGDAARVIRRRTVGLGI